MKLHLTTTVTCSLILLLTGYSTQQKESDKNITDSGPREVTSKGFQTTLGSTKPSETASKAEDGKAGSLTSMRALSDLARDVNKPAATIVQNDGDQNDQDGTDVELSPFNVRDITSDMQSANLERTVAPEGTSSTPLANSATTSSQPTCTQRTHKGCDVINYERCTQMGTCECLRGYLKDVITEKCIAAQFFTGEIELANDYTEDFADKSSDAYIKLTSQLQQVLLRAFKSQDVAGILRIKVTNIATEKVLVTFEIAVDKVNSGGRDYLQRQYYQGLTSTAHRDENEGLVKLKGTDLILGTNGSIAWYLKPFTETNHCVERAHNYCDVNARCTHKMRSFTCSCNDGFVDVSPDKLRTPGEQCAVKCPCRNNGTCDSVNGKTECRCPKWFIGSNCEINGKDLLIICCSVLGGLLVLTVLLCLVCICAVKNRKSSRSSTVGVGSLDTSVVKLPRVWMDGTRPYELPPRDTRRWSYVSEPIRYVDEYMMDDYVHAETLPLPRSHDAKKRFYPAYGNQAYSSSTLNIRPASRH
ncbi:uncharacterized protein LOC124147935 isoform X1 [Haliotis rufescens]|uniref:uncharacterized protein LOC124147935 isoform X1 n=2 Tax=Haliotis rufescens TaxID=6454 RepID=UPI001EAFA9E7|nr:uncharacterized protein LOC124147935 isoform X1 [Haliotis rufescens]